MKKTEKSEVWSANKEMRTFAKNWWKSIICQMNDFHQFLAKVLISLYADQTSLFSFFFFIYYLLKKYVMFFSLSGNVVLVRTSYFESFRVNSSFWGLNKFFFIFKFVWGPSLIKDRAFSLRNRFCDAYAPSRCVFRLPVKFCVDLCHTWNFFRIFEIFSTFLSGLPQNF